MRYTGSRTEKASFGRVRLNTALQSARLNLNDYSAGVEVPQGEAGPNRDF
jgi:hypothetical protein